MGSNSKKGIISRLLGNNTPENASQADSSGEALSSRTTPQGAQSSSQSSKQSQDKLTAVDYSESLRSGRPSTISTYQSSIFSRPTVSTGLSSSRGTHFPATIDEGNEDPSQQGKPMKLVAPETMSTLTDASENTDSPAGARHTPVNPSPPRATSTNHLTSHISDLSSANNGPPINIQSPRDRHFPTASSGPSSARRPLSQPLSPSQLPPVDLDRLADELFFILDQAVNKPSELSRCASSTTQLIKITASNPALDGVIKGQYSLHANPAIPRIIKTVLHYADNLLINQMQPAKMYMLRALYQLGARLKLVPISHGTVPHPTNFAFASSPSNELAGAARMLDLMNIIISDDDSSISEQDGAFIAPLLRGFSSEFAVPTLSFGFPRPDASHYHTTASMYDISRDIHIYCHKNFIRTCAQSFKVPYRIPAEPQRPPMSVSLATEHAGTLSGTLGGYIYPKIDTSQPDLAEYGKSTFAMTCAHVCLSENEGRNYPNVVVPSPVLVKLYRKALLKERDSYALGSTEYHEYDRVVAQLDRRREKSKKSQTFGQIVWGERTIVDGRISDLAIIRCNSDTPCKNFLGDDIPFSEYDPALMFGNLYVKRMIKKPAPGIDVFKYGSTSKYTRGKINGPRLVYWADGRIQSSEFAVNSDSPVFASGGDSGAWILHRCDSESGPCLGVVGMLHSYDGEKKELGLFTSMPDILQRLHEVTHIRWGIVGVDEDSDEEPAGGSETDNEGTDYSESSNE